MCFSKFLALLNLCIFEWFCDMSTVGSIYGFSIRGYRGPTVYYAILYKKPEHLWILVSLGPGEWVWGNHPHQFPADPEEWLSFLISIGKKTESPMINLLLNPCLPKSFYLFLSIKPWNFWLLGLFDVVHLWVSSQSASWEKQLVHSSCWSYLFIQHLWKEYQIEK